MRIIYFIVKLDAYDILRQITRREFTTIGNLILKRDLTLGKQFVLTVNIKQIV